MANRNYFSIAASILVLLYALVPGTSQSQKPENSEKKISVVHRPLASNAISQVGSTISIQIELLNTYDIDAKIRLVGAKDGRFIDISFPRGALNELDHPTFSIEIPSPLAVMSYQFVVHQRDGSLSSSEKFIIKRNCIQNFKVTVPEDGKDGDFRREISSLVGQAKLFERDTISLESSLKLIEDIKASLSN